MSTFGCYVRCKWFSCLMDLIGLPGQSLNQNILGKNVIRCRLKQLFIRSGSTSIKPNKANKYPNCLLYRESYLHAGLQILVLARALASSLLPQASLPTLHISLITVLLSYQCFFITAFCLLLTDIGDNWSPSPFPPMFQLPPALRPHHSCSGLRITDIISFTVISL